MIQRPFRCKSSVFSRWFGRANVQSPFGGAAPWMAEGVRECVWRVMCVCVCVCVCKAVCVFCLSNHGVFVDGGCMEDDRVLDPAQWVF